MCYQVPQRCAHVLPGVLTLLLGSSAPNISLSMLLQTQSGRWESQILMDMSGFKNKNHSSRDQNQVFLLKKASTLLTKPSPQPRWFQQLRPLCPMSGSEAKALHGLQGNLFWSVKETGKHVVNCVRGTGLLRLCLPWGKEGHCRKEGQERGRLRRACGRLLSRVAGLLDVS